MTDLGIYNFIKHALSEGKTKEDIINSLSKNRSLSKENIEEVFADVAANHVPVVESDAPKKILGEDLAAEEKGITNVPLKAAMATLVIIGIVVGYMYFGPSGSMPVAADIEHGLRDFMVEEGKKDCKGEFTVSRLERVTVGEYSDEFEAWPIYAAYVTDCKTEKSSYTYKELAGPEKKTAVAFARKSGSGYEVFMPEMIRKLQDEMGRQMEGMF